MQRIHNWYTMMGRLYFIASISVFTPYRIVRLQKLAPERLEFYIGCVHQNEANFIR